MLERGYEGFRAYSQSKLALVMLTFDLADELRHAGVTANCLHPATFVPTRMVLDAGVAPQSSLATGSPPGRPPRRRPAVGPPRSRVR
jgi:NAD(P)-dependent dehydrogenase (short-subunit alcohol dehydrogenase family)